MARTLRVLGMSGACSVITSLVSSTSSNGVYKRPEALDALVRRVQGAHAERLTEARHRLPDRAFADDAERGAVEVPDRVSEEAELAGLLPLARDDVLAVADQ